MITKNIALLWLGLSVAGCDGATVSGESDSVTNAEISDVCKGIFLQAMSLSAQAENGLINVSEADAKAEVMLKKIEQNNC